MKQQTEEDIFHSFWEKTRLSCIFGDSTQSPIYET